MQVAVCGPNLNDQSKGDFHVHAAKCGDVKHYGYGKKFGGEDPWIIEAASTKDVTTAVYAPSDFNYDENTDELAGFEQTLYFEPCCRKEL